MKLDHDQVILMSRDITEKFQQAMGPGQGTASDTSTALSYYSLYLHIYLYTREVEWCSRLL